MFNNFSKFIFNFAWQLLKNIWMPKNIPSIHFFIFQKLNLKSWGFSKTWPLQTKLLHWIDNSAFASIAIETLNISDILFKSYKNKTKWKSFIFIILVPSSIWILKLNRPVFRNVKRELLEDWIITENRYCEI